MVRRVVVTGRGIVSCIGNHLDVVERALRNGRSGLRHVPEYAELGLRSQVAGIPDISNAPPVNRKFRRFMGDAALYAYYAAQSAIDEAHLSTALLRCPRTGVIVGSGVGSPFEHFTAMSAFREKGIEKIPPYCVPRVMGSTTSASLATIFGITGTSFSISSA